MGFEMRILIITLALSIHKFEDPLLYVGIRSLFFIFLQTLNYHKINGNMHNTFLVRNFTYIIITHMHTTRTRDNIKHKKMS